MIILSKHIIALLIHILLSMSVLIKGEALVERYHAHRLEIGGLNNQAKIKGRLCFRVSPFAWVRLVSWSGLWGGGRGERGEKDRTRGGWMWQLDIPPVKNPSIFSQATELGQRGLCEHAHTFVLQCADVYDFLCCILVSHRIRLYLF